MENFINLSFLNKNDEMGIKNGYEILSPCGQSININDLAYSSIAIDMMTYIVKLYKNHNSFDWYQKVIDFVNNFIKHKITCVCVFDGHNKPLEKGKKNRYNHNREIYRNAVAELAMFENGKTDVLVQKYNKTLPEIYSFITSQIQQIHNNMAFPQESEIRKVMILLESVLNCEVYISNGEGENLCCYFLKTGKVSYVLSEDSDVLLYGIDKFLMKLNGNICKLFKTKDILEYHKLTFEELFCLCMILGTDYNNGLEGINFKKGYKLVKREGENIKFYIPNYKRLKTIFTPDPYYSKCIYNDVEARTIMRSLN